MSICTNLNVGLLFPFRNPPAWRKPFADFYAEQLAQTRVAEELGYDEIWLTEHHFAEDGYSPAILPIASAIAAITKRIRIGTYLVLLPLHNAVRVAEDAATIDIISNGRFDLGVGQGYAPGEFAAYGVNRKTRAGRLEEGIEVMRGAWTKDDFSYDGQALQCEERPPDAASGAVAASSAVDRRRRAQGDRARGADGMSFHGPRESGRAKDLR